MSVTLLLRVIHILFGVFWAGVVFFMVSFLQPAVGRAGPEGGKVMAELNRARFFTWMPLIALVTILSGGWLMWGTSSGFEGAFFASRWGVSLSIGAVASLVAFGIGAAVMRPASARMFEIGGQMAKAAPENRQALMAEMAGIQKRAGKAARWMAALLLIAVITMAAARAL
jgi:hypothetical protein